MQKRAFGNCGNQEEATLYSFENKNGMRMEVTDFGATLYALYVPDENGVLQDVVLGYEDASVYDSGRGTHFGATVGRCANRTGYATFTLNGKTYHLNKNCGEHNLHSGPDSYSLRMWTVKQVTDNSITFSLHSPDGDQGYPGALDVDVTYTLTEENAVQLDYCVTIDQDTPVNITNHSYFNLNGHDSGNILNHQLWVGADYYTGTDENSITTGELIPVEGTPMDFRQKKAIGQDVEADYQALHWAGGYDHNWCIDRYDGQKFENREVRKVAELEANANQIKMEVYTDLPGVQVYISNALTQEPGKRGVVYAKRQAVCFETQYYPNAINHEHFEGPVCKAGEYLKTRTIYKFVCR